MTTLLTRRALLRAMAMGSAGFALGGTGLGCAVPGLRFPGGQRRRRLRLVFYTDVHARTEWDTPLALARATEAINAERPDLVLAGGDLVAGGFRSSAEKMAPRWDVYMQMHRGIEAEVRAAVGNHDLVAAAPRDGTPPAADPRAVYRTRLELDRSYYSFDANGVHFVVLDAIRVVGGKEEYHGTIGAEQRDWLREDLSRVLGGTPVVAVTHIPLLTAFYGATQGLAMAAPRNRVVTNNVEVLRLFEGHGLVLVLQGHLHVAEAVQWRGTTFLTGGAICGKWWRGAWHGTPEGFCVVTLEGERVQWRYVPYGWEARRPDGA